MLDPIFRFELWRASRHRRQFILRWIYGTWLILQILLYYTSYLNQFYGTWLSPPNTNAAGQIATQFIQSLIWQQVILTVLITPIFVAGTLTDEKVSGTLQYLLMTELTIGEIVFAKILAGMVQVLYLMIVTLPICAGLILFAGIDLPFFFMITLWGIAPIFTLSAFSVLVSVWSRQSRDALILVYLILFGFWILTQFAPSLSQYVPNHVQQFLRYFYPLLDPYSVLSNLSLTAGWENFLQHLVSSLVAWLALGLVFTLLAVLRLRPVYNRQLEQRRSWFARSLSVLASRASVGDAAIFWKEQQVEGLSPVRVLNYLPRAFCIAFLVGLCLAVSLLILLATWPGRPDEFYQALFRLDIDYLQNEFDRTSVIGLMISLHTIAFFLFTFTVGIRASGTISTEREKQTWEQLLLTPLTTEQIIYGKYWGILIALLLYFVAYASTIFPAVLITGFNSLISYILFMIHIVLYALFLGSIGIWYSVKSTSSWSALLNTILVGYFATAVVYFLALPVLAMFSCCFFCVLSIAVSSVGPIGAGGNSAIASISLILTFGTVILLDVLLLAAAYWFLQRAIRLIGRRESSRYEQIDDFTEQPNPA